jgi:hypothetical protein
MCRDAYLSDVAPHGQVVYQHLEEIIVFDGILELLELRNAKRRGSLHSESVSVSE